MWQDERKAVVFIQEKVWLLPTGSAIFQSYFSCINTPAFPSSSHTSSTCLWRWNRRSVPKRRHIKLRRRGITQKKKYYTINKISHIFWTYKWWGEWIWGVPQQDGAHDHTDNNSEFAWRNSFGDRITCWSSWPTRSPDLMEFLNYLRRGCFKYKAHKSNPRQTLQNYIQCLALNIRNFYTRIKKKK